jgi:hypothetical protein
MKRALWVMAIPIPDAKRGVARGLHFGCENSPTERVTRAAREIDAVAARNGETLEVFECASILDGGAKLSWGCRGTKSAVNARARLCRKHDPRFGLEMSVLVCANVRGVGMHLNRQILRGVEEFEKEWKATVRRGGGETQEFVAVECAKLSHCSTVEWPAEHRGLSAFNRGRKVCDFPRFADPFSRKVGLSKPA